MNIWDWIILIINIVCLIGSIIGAVQAHSSYKKCKQLTNFANLKVALDQCQLIFENCRKLLKLCGNGSKCRRGVNIEKEVSECGCSIKNSFSKIKEILPSSSQEIVNKLLSESPNQKKDVEKYVSFLISGHAIENGDFTEDNISEIEKTVGTIHLHIKVKMEEMQEGEKKL